MKRPYGKLILVLIPILLVTGVTLLWRHLTQSVYPDVPTNTTNRIEALQQSDYPNVPEKKTEALKLADVPAAPGAPRPSLDRLPGSARVANQPAVSDLPRPMPDRRGRHGSVEEAIERVSAAPNLESQIQAIRDLGNFQDPQTLQVLRPALHSQVTEVRKAALEAMRYGTVDDPATLAEVRNAVTKDLDLEVQQAALEVLVRYDESAEARRLLEKLASDPSGVHRDFALRELERMDLEADARGRPDTQVQQDKTFK